MTLYIKIISGREIPVADAIGLSDPFCILKLVNRNDKQKTLIRKQALTPVWNQEFQFKILSYNNDSFRLSLFDYDKYSKNDLLGQWNIAIKEIKLVVVEEKELIVGGLIKAKYQLAYANQCKWDSKESKPMKLLIKVIEAKDFPNNAGKTDPYLELYFENDTIKKKLKLRIIIQLLNGLNSFIFSLLI